MRFPASLRQSLTLHFLVVAVLPLLLLGIGGYRFFLNEHLKTIADLNDSHALNVSRVAGELIDDTHHSLSLVAKTLTSGLLQNDVEINYYLQLVIDETNIFESIYLLDENLRVTHLGLSEGHGGHRSDFLGMDLSGREMFRSRTQLSSPTWSNTFLSSNSLEPAVNLAIPLEKGSLLGTLSLKKLSAELVTRLKSVKDTFQFSVLDHHGILIADSRPGLTSQRLNLRNHPEVLSALDNREEVTSKFHEDMSLLESVRLISTTGWVAYVSLPMQEAMQEMTTLRNLLLSMLGFATGLGIVLALWLSERMARPILQVRDAVREVARGRYSHILQPAPYEELEELSARFREMVGAVDERESALRASEALFRSVFETNPDSVLITRLRDGQITRVNESFLRITGYSRAEVVGRTSVALELWASPAEFETTFNQLHAHGGIENFEVTYCLKSGHTRIGLLSARDLVLNEESCLIVVIRDITEMKDAEKRLTRSESRFRSLVSVMGEGVIIFGYKGEVVQCNQAAERLLRKSTGDIVGRLYDELIFNAIDEDGLPCEPAKQPAAYTLFCGEAVKNRIMGLPGADGHTTWLQVNTHHLGLDSHGQPLAVVMSFADVTRLKLIEEELRVNENSMQILSQQFRGVLEAIPDQIMVIDRDMGLVWLNRRTDKALASQVELAGIPCFAMPEIPCGVAAGNESSLCDHCPVKKTFVSGQTEAAQLSLADSRTLSLRAFPVYDECGQVINVIQTVQDVTENIRQQAQAMRTGQLAALGELAAGVAHEINNPINGVINYAQLILNKAVAGSREQELSQRIIRESERVATIVRELLFFAREESGEIHRTSVRQALDEALSLTRNQLNKEGVELQILLPDDLPQIVSYSHQVQQLFLNLISNARYALTEKYPAADPDKRLLIKGQEIFRDQKSFVQIVFRDHGIGIDEQLLPKVMNPFVTTKPSSEGTGLGLSISHEIVQKHGGSLSINSVRGEFTEVVFELPSAKS